MGNNSILHLTCMPSTKYGALELYFVELARIGMSKGYQSFFQYETAPNSQAYLKDLVNVGAKLIVRRTFQPLNIGSSYSNSRYIFTKKVRQKGMPPLVIRTLARPCRETPRGRAGCRSTSGTAPRPPGTDHN